MQGFVLGLSSGAVCAAYCAPVLVPCLLGEGRGVLANFWALLLFLMGRLLGYLGFALLAWGINQALLKEAGERSLLIGTAYVALSVLLVFYGFFRPRHACPAVGGGGFEGRLRGSWPSLLFFVSGVATGLNFCPPFLLAVTAAAQEGSLAGSLFFFFTFFLGTSVFLIPAPFLGLLAGRPVLQTVGKMAAGLIGAYYLYIGITLLAGGLLS